MADNVRIATSGGTVTIATDDIGSVHYQRVKMTTGIDGTAVDVSAASPVPIAGTVTVTDGSGPVTVDGSVAVSGGTVVVQDGGGVITTDGTVVLGAGAAAIGSVSITGTATVAGNVAHDAADSGNPVKVGGRAGTILPAAVADGDRVDSIHDTLGRQLVVPFPVDQSVSGTANLTGTVAGTVIAAPGSRKAVVVTSILVVNKHASVGTLLTVRDGSTGKVPGGAGANYGGWQVSHPHCLFKGSENTAITAICGTNGADVDVTVFGYLVPA